MDTEDSRTELAQQACQERAVLEELVEQLASTSRIRRQKTASVIALVADEDASVLVPYIEQLGEGLMHPEAQTRWELLHVLNALGALGQTFDDEVIGAAQDALYDESNGIVREAAFRFFCSYGAASPAHSDEVWLYIDEAIQCYHGNGEFTDMLTCLVEFAQGDISMETSTALASRMRFDAENGSGTLRMRAGQIMEAFKAHGGSYDMLSAPARPGENA